MAVNLFIKILFLFSCTGLFFLLFTYSSPQKECSLLNWIKSALITISSIVLTSFILLIANYFSIVSLTLAVSILCISIFLFLKHKKQTDDWKANILKLAGSTIVPLLVLVVFLVGFLPKISEWSVSSGMDAGNYINIASRFANTGKFFDDFNYDQKSFSCLSGYYCSDGLLKPAYLHVYPILLSLGDLLDKDYGMVAMQLIFSGLSALSFYVLVQSVFKNKYISIISLIIFILNPLQILYSKEFMSEILSQFFLFTGLTLLYKSYQEKDSGLSIWGGISFSLMLLTKFDSLIIVVPLCLIGGYLYLRQDSKLRLFRYSYTPFFLVSIYYLTIAKTYTLKSLFGSFDFPDSAIYISFIPIFYFIIASFNIFPKLRLRLGELLEKNIRTLFLVFVILLEAFVAYRMISFFTNADSFTKFPHDYINLLRLSLFTAPLVLVGAVGGVICLVKSTEKKTANIISVLFPFMFILFINLYRSMHSAPLYWWGRRYLPFTIPLLAILAGYFFYKLFIWTKHHFIVTKFLLAVTFFYILIIYAMPAFEYKQNSGINSQVKDFAEIVPYYSTVISQKRWQIELVGASMASIYNKKILFYKAFPSKDFLENAKSGVGGLYWMNPSPKEIASLNQIGFEIGNCTVKDFDYSYYYSGGNFCNGKKYCMWFEDLTTFRNKFSLSLCEVNSVN